MILFPSQQIVIFPPGHRADRFLDRQPDASHRPGRRRGGRPHAGVPRPQAHHPPHRRALHRRQPRRHLRQRRVLHLRGQGRHRLLHRHHHALAARLPGRGHPPGGQRDAGAAADLARYKLMLIIAVVMAD